MVQIELITGLDSKDLQDQVNRFLNGIEGDALQDVRIDLERFDAVILYEVIEAWKNRKCFDCKYWDDEGSTSSVSGLCHEHGQRRRFNCNACASFIDLRR